MVDLEQQAREMSRRAALGAPVGPPVALATLPLRRYAGSILLVIVAVVCLAAAAWLGREPKPETGPIVGLGAVGLLCAAIGGFLLYRRVAERSVLALHERGLVVTRFGKSSALAFAEAESLTIQEKEHLNNGVRDGLQREVRLRSASESVGFSRLSLDAQSDGVGPLLQALRARFGEAAEARLRGGAALQGKGWSLDGAGFHGKGGPVPIDQIADAAAFQDQVSLWSGDDELPFFSVPAGSSNALVLLDIVSRRLGERPRPRHDEGLGRVLFEKRSGLGTIAGLGLLGLGLTGLGLYLLIARDGDPVGGAFCLAGGCGFAVGAAWAAGSRLRCHERGLAKRSLFGEQVMRYAEIDRLTYGATRHYHNGVYTGTHIQMTFASDTAGKPIRYSTQTRGSEADLELLRDQVSQMVAGRLHERVVRDGEVAWTPGVRLSAKGAHFRRRKLLGKGEETLAPFADELRFSIDAGEFHLFVPGEKKSALDLLCSAENFWPGFLLFRRLAAEAAQPGGA